MMKRLYSLLLLLFLTAISCGGESSGKTTDADSAKSKPKVRVVRASEAKLPRTISVSGTLAGEEEVALSMKVQGRIQQIFVDLGSRVQRGQPLVKLEPSDFEIRLKQAAAAYQQARVRLGLPAEGRDDEAMVNVEQTGVVKQAKAVLEEARLSRERMESLHRDGLVAKSEFDDAQAAFQVAEARYQDSLEEVRTRQALLFQRKAEMELAEKQLSDSTMRAPLDGAIQERSASPGQFVAVGDQVLTLVRVHPLRLKLALPERESSNLRIGQGVNVRVEGDERVHQGKVARLSPALSSDNRTLTVEAEVPNQSGQLRPGSFARAEIITEAEHPAVLVPATSVVTFAGINKVISIKDNQTIEKRIRPGRRTLEHVEVLEGLQAGEPVVVQPGNIVSGQEVTPVWNES